MMEVNSIVELSADASTDDVEKLLEEQEQEQFEDVEFEREPEIETKTIPDDAIVAMASGLYFGLLDMFFARQGWQAITESDRAVITPTIEVFVDQMPDLPVSGPMAAGMAVAGATAAVCYQKKEQAIKDGTATQASQERREDNGFFNDGN